MGEDNCIKVIITSIIIVCGGDRVLLISVEYGSFTFNSVTERLETFICVQTLYKYSFNFVHTPQK